MNLIDDIGTHFRLKETQKTALGKLGLKTINDLLYHFPFRFEQSVGEGNIMALNKGEVVFLEGVITSNTLRRVFRSKKTMSKGVLQTKEGKVDLVWFHQPYIAKQFPAGSLVSVRGKVMKGGSSGCIVNPDISMSDNTSFYATNADSQLIPKYAVSKGITSKWIGSSVAKILKNIDKFNDPIPEIIRKKYSLPDKKESLLWVHFPKKIEYYEVAKKRFSFEEVFLLHILRRQKYTENKKQSSIKINVDKKLTKKLISKFPFTPTNAQKRVIEDILADLKKQTPMSRLLEGDVGSGKTAVATTVAHSVVLTKPKGQSFGTLQVAYMAPTELLAKQQFDTITHLFKDLPISIGLITSNICKKFPSNINPNEATDISKAQLKKWMSNGDISIVVGTHSLIQKDVGFKHLALVIVDEQHRFGVAHRQKLLGKSEMQPHLLSMTATPIPRTLALTIYGDLDVSVIDELPPERKPVETKVIVSSEKNKLYSKITEEIEKGHQVYVVCPRIDSTKEDETSNLHSVADITKELKNQFPKHKIKCLHGQQKKDEKTQIMEKLKEGSIDILVSTTVIEVGVNIKNATVMIIMNADRFGLAQLHQLRGRVSRSSHQPFCFAVTDSKNKITLKRLNFFKQHTDGFMLAEKDLLLRGAGEFSGISQSGVSDLAMEALKNIKLVEAAQLSAKEILSTDSKLKKHPAIAESILNRSTHFE